MKNRLGKIGFEKTPPPVFKEGVNIIFKDGKPTGMIKTQKLTKKEIEKLYKVKL